MLVRDGKSKEWITVNKFRLNIDKNNLNNTLVYLKTLIRGKLAITQIIVEDTLYGLYHI